MEVTIAICTWNRAGLLDQTLTRMEDLRIPNGVEWELLVVNNNSTDHTDEVIARHSSKLPIRRLFELQPGHCNARNCAVDHARGELLLWTDDDVLVADDWLSVYVSAARAWPEVSFFGGKVNPWFEVQPPKWIIRHLRQLAGPYALRQLGDSVRPLERDEMPFGANMAFRLDAQKTYRYDPALGRVGKKMISGDETSVIGRMRDDGLKGVWVGDAIVDHFIPKERLTTKYLESYFTGSGQTHIMIEGVPALPMLFGVPRTWIRMYVSSLVKSWIYAPCRNSTWLTAFRKAATIKGMIQQHYIDSRKIS